MILKYISFKNFICYGPNTQFYKLNKFNIISGPNNFGKSVIMRALQRVYSMLEHNLPDRKYTGISKVGGSLHSRMQFINDDFHNEENQIQIELSIIVDENTYCYLYNIVLDAYKEQPRIRVEAKNIHSISKALIEKPRPAIDFILNNFARKIVYIPSERHIKSFLHRKDIPFDYQEKYDGRQTLPYLMEIFNSSPHNNLKNKEKIQKIYDFISEITGFKEIRFFPVSDEAVFVNIVVV